MDTSPLDKVRDAFQLYLQFSPDDRPAVDYFLATCLANRVQPVTDPVWGWLIGPPACGKNEVMRTMSEHSSTYYVDDLTPNSLMSGHKSDDDPEMDPSLLPHLDKRTLCVEDFTTLTEKGDLAVNQLLAAFRGLYGDEKRRKSSGTAGQREYKVVFGFFSGVTGVIDSFNTRHQQLGARFVGLRMMRHAVDRAFDKEIAHIRHVQKAAKTKDVWRPILAGAAMECVDRVLSGNPSVQGVTTTDAIENQLAVLSNAVTRLRTAPIHGAVMDAECAHRFVQQITMIGKAHALLDGRTYWDYPDTALVIRVANDTMPRFLVRILRALIPPDNPDRQPVATADLQCIAQIGPHQMHRTLSQWNYLGIVERSKRGYTTMVQATDDIETRLRASGWLLGESGLV